jgi:hypothetical protein
MLMQIAYTSISKTFHSISTSRPCYQTTPLHNPMSPRTRSCATCRKKRIKCDATRPHCLMCVRYGRQCPGLDSGPLIVDMTNKARYGMQKRKKKPIPSPESFLEFALQHHSSINQISHQSSITEAFYARFLSFFTSEGEGKDIRNRATWLHRLPLLSVDGTNDALTLAVQATASAYCAAESSNTALIRHAWDLYGRAIQTHSRFLARSQKGIASVTIHMISTSVLFSFFEAMQATSADAYRSHIYGAAKMFEVTDPTQCHEGVLCQLFFHIRTQMAFVQLTSRGEKAPLDVKRILHESLEYEVLPMSQRLAGHFTGLADKYSEGKRGEVALEAEEFEDIREQVEGLWQEYSGATSRVDRLPFPTGPLASALEHIWLETSDRAPSKGELLSWTDPLTGETCYRDTYTALMISYFCGTHVLLNILAPHLASNDETDHYNAILDASKFMSTRLIGCAYMRMAAPLLLVAMHAPDAAQRLKAIGYFEGWKTGSMRGISALALECTNRNYFEAVRTKQKLVGDGLGKNGFVEHEDEGVYMPADLVVM